jgi:hypothetical protein
VAGPAATDTPAQDYLDAFRCPRGLSRVILTGGVEDGFDRAGSEPSRIDPPLLSYGYYQDLAARRNRVLMLRDYDEGGTDRMLIDHFTVPAGTVLGQLVLRTRAQGGGSNNDHIGLTPRREGTAAERFSQGSFSVALAGAELQTVGDPANGLGIIRLDQIRGNVMTRRPSLMDELREADTALEVSVAVQDDTAVDMMALALCTEPAVVQGLTFAEHAAKPAGPDISVLSCSLDDTQHMCGPTQGDTPCSQSLPLACYREGGAAKPPDLTAAGLDEAKFVPGAVRLSTPVRGDTLATREEADARCAAEFGAGYRVLRYQEAGDLAQRHSRRHPRLDRNPRPAPRHLLEPRPARTAAGGLRRTLGSPVGSPDPSHCNGNPCCAPGRKS